MCFASVSSDLLSNLQSNCFRSSFVCFSELAQEINRYSSKKLSEMLSPVIAKANQAEASFKRAFKRCHEVHADLAAAICVHREKVRYFIYV